jgi:hypothetical protein
MELSERASAGLVISLAAMGLSILLGLGGCSGAPVVDYAPGKTAVNTPSDLNDVHRQYALWTTALHFKKDAGGEMTVTAATADDPARTNVLRIAGQDHWYKTTALDLVTASDSEVPTTVNVTVTDHLATYIGIASELAVTGLTAVRSPPPPHRNPRCDEADTVPAVPADAAFDENLNVFEFLRRLDASGGCPGLSEKQVPARQLGFAADGAPAVAVLSLDAPPDSALRLDQDSAPEILAAAKNVFLFPACRGATLQYLSTVTATGKPTRQVHHTLRFRFSDPRYVQAIPLPVKGSLTVKPQCGMSLASDSGNATTAADIAKAMADAVQSVAGAVKSQ